jgi:hypothetical protein
MARNFFQDLEQTALQTNIVLHVSLRAADVLYW